RYFDAPAGKRLSKRLTDLSEANNCVVHRFTFDLPSLMAFRLIWSAVGRRLLELRETAVNRDFAGGHEAAVRRCEKGRCRPELCRIGHTLKRSHRGVYLLALFSQRFLREFGCGRAGRQHVYPDTGALQVLRPG